MRFNKVGVFNITTAIVCLLGMINAFIIGWISFGLLEGILVILNIILSSKIGGKINGRIYIWG